MTTPPLPPDDAAVPNASGPGPSADQDPPMPEVLADEHLTLDELADLAVDELPDEAPAAAAHAHLAGCAHCRAELELLRADLDRAAAELGSWRTDGPAAAMPVTVAARLDRVLADEAETRAAGRDATVTPLRRPTPLRAPVTASYVKQTGTVRIMLAAAMAAAVVGFGGYVVSASAGLNEPSALSPTQIHPEALASQAESLAQRRDLDAHPFSAAWRCARKVTSGRVTGITPVYVNGEQSYLVYTRSGGVTYATLISGCDTAPTAGPRVRLSE